MEKQEIILSPLENAKSCFDQALLIVRENDELQRDGCIKRFECCYEIAWETLSRILKSKEIEVHGSRDTIRTAAQVGYIDDPEKWFGYIEMHNQIAHAYNPDISELIFNQLKDFQEQLDSLFKKLQENLSISQS